MDVATVPAADCTAKAPAPEKTERAKAPIQTRTAESRRIQAKAARDLELKVRLQSPEPQSKGALPKLRFQALVTEKEAC